MNPMSRRDVLRTVPLAGVAAGVATVSCQAANDHGNGTVPTFVFVTGSNGVAAGDAELTMRGYRTVGVELPGHGPEADQFHASYQAPQDLAMLGTRPSPMAGITLEDYANAAIAVVRRVAPYGPVIVVGASAGGVVVNRMGNAVGDLIGHMVYDSAFCCVDLPSITDYFRQPEASTSLGENLTRGIVADPAMIDAIRLNWRWADARFLADAKAALAADSTDAEFLTFLNSSLPDESLHVDTADARIEPATWGRLPRSYIRHAADRLIPLPLQDRMIREADAKTRALGTSFAVHTVDTAHYPSTLRYREIINILDAVGKSLSQ